MNRNICGAKVSLTCIAAANSLKKEVSETKYISAENKKIITLAK